MTTPAPSYDALPIRRGRSPARLRRGFLVFLLALVVLVIPLWDAVLLPFYTRARLHVTVIPLLLLGLCTMVLFWLFFRIKKNEKDPVRRSPAAWLGLIGFIGLNVVAFVLFDQGWSLISVEARWAGIVLIMVNVQGAWFLFYLFRMRWNRATGTRRRIHEAVVQSLRQAPAWHEPPPYLKRKEATGWRHSSSVYAHTLYFEFARAYEAALEPLQHHLTRHQIDQWKRVSMPETPREADALSPLLTAPLEPCLKAGNALVFYLAFFDDVNGHRAWLAQEIAWRILNIKLLHLAVCLTVLPDDADPATVLQADVADLKRLYRLYQSTVFVIADPADARAIRQPLHALVARSGPWRSAALQNRLCHLFLRGIYHTREHEAHRKDWAGLWQRPVEDGNAIETFATGLPSESHPVFFKEVAAVWNHLGLYHEHGIGFQSWKAERLFRQLAMETDLPSPLTRFLDALTALMTTPPIPDDEADPGVRIAVSGFKADGLEDDITNLLLALPQLDADDVNATDFPLLWTNATVLWMLEDLIVYERTLSSVQFKDVLQDPLWDRAHPQIRPAVRRLMQAPRSRQRWRENQTLLARSTNDPTLTLQQTGELLG